eukprot:TRINITY_DN695_c0_g1_i1.p1 TRINITY_DN695_c0_g1~~TRINITY_DN695_c0_g1_i1.p1  ORF type:complete len:179 (-),score=53.35 TRINITY_DN695_c0_g1_i1:69-605(-)
MERLCVQNVFQLFFFFQAEDGIRDFCLSRGLGDVYKRQINAEYMGTDDNFDQLVMKSEKPFFIKFFAPWCGHCKRMHPDWVNLASEVKDIVTIAQVDCTVHKNICSKFGVRGYPTLKFLPEGEKAVEKAIDYRQARTVDAWKAFIMENIKVEEEVKEEEVKEEEVKEEEVKEEEKQDL